MKDDMACEIVLVTSKSLRSFECKYSPFETKTTPNQTLSGLPIDAVSSFPDESKSYDRR